MGNDIKIKKVKKPSKQVMKLNRKKFLQDMLDFNKKFFVELEEERKEKERGMV